MIAYYRYIATTALSCIISHIARYWSKIAKFIYPACVFNATIGGDPVRISQRCLVGLPAAIC